MDENQERGAKILPINPQNAEDMGELITKSWDTANASDTTNELFSSELQAFLDANTLKSLFYSEDWVYIVVDLIASKISSVPLVVKQDEVSNGKKATKIVDDHPLTELIEQPNEWQSYEAWIYNTCVELYLMGNSVIWQAKKTGQLITLPTENISMDFDNKARLSQYLVASVNQDDSGLRDLDVTQRIPADEVIHLRRPNPQSMLWGLSPFIPARKSILFNRYSKDYLNAFYLKQATPGLALSLDRNVNEDQALRQLRAFELAYQGRKNTRRTLILPKGVSVESLTHTLSDQKLREHMGYNREDLLALLKVPKHEVGLQEAGSLGSEEAKVALRNFWEATLIPGMGMISGGLTKAFQEELGEGFYLDFDTSEVEALRDDLEKKADTASKMLRAGLSLNEVRTQVWKQDPSEDPSADTPYVLVEQRASALDVGGGRDASTDSDGGQQSQRSVQPKKIKITERVERIRKSRTKSLADEEGRTIRGLSESSIDLLVGMTLRAIEVIEKSDKALLVRKDLPSRRVLSSRISRALAEDFEENWSNDYVRTLSTSVELGYDQGLELVFNAESRQEIEALRVRDEEGRRLTLQARGLDSFAEISKTHTERIMRQIQEGQEKNESITDIMRRVGEALGTPGQLSGKAETIARTETLTAVSLGQAAVMNDAKEVIPDLKKVWLTAGDSRVRDSHIALDGDMIDVDEKFANGLRHPRDTKSGDASEVINCRCTVLLLPPDAEDLAFEIP